MNANQHNVQGLETLSPSECREISGGSEKCITGSDGAIYKVERTVDSSGHVTITVTRDPFCGIGGV